MLGFLRNVRAGIWSFLATLSQYGVGFWSFMAHTARGSTLCLGRNAQEDGRTPLCEENPNFSKEEENIVNDTNETNEIREIQMEAGSESNAKTWTAWGEENEVAAACVALPNPFNAVDISSHNPSREEMHSAGDDKTTEAPTPAAATKQTVWWVDLGSWVRMDNETQELMRQAVAEGKSFVEFEARGQPYRADFEMMMQINMRTSMCRAIKATEPDEIPEDDEEESAEDDEDFDEDDLLSKIRKGAPSELPKRDERLENLVNLLLSEAVQVPLPAEAKEEKEKLSHEEVKKVFKDHVPGVHKFLFRDQPGQYSLNFLATAYSSGLRAFSGTAMENHLKWLMRSIVHYGHDKKPGAAKYLKEVAEAFLDCQAVQARVVERCGLELLGVSQDFHGLVRALVGDYKVMGIKMLAMDHLSRGVVSDDGNPTHYENRLTADLGKLLGLNKDDIRRADLDEHAGNRFGRLQGPNADKAVLRFKELFDLEALAKTFCNEVNSFNESTSKDSLAGQFMKWADECLTQKHAIFDEETCSQVVVEEPLAMAILEVLFAGKPSAGEESYRGTPINELFREDALKVKEEEPKPPPPPNPKAASKAGSSPKGKKQRTRK
mmetsp:Transcript_87639/g.209469  ORF Transcript_87639/g.209469 Transcript_87639/m.209469 type:complete len:606 (-) Transcript_87639:70-1887(-)